MGIEMEKKKLTDEEIAKAYVYCRTAIDCDNCPYDAWGCGIGVKDIIDIINRQTAEIERLTEENSQISEMADYDKGYKEGYEHGAKMTAEDIFEKMLFEFRHYGKNEKLTKPQVLGTLEKIVKSKGVEVD